MTSNRIPWGRVVVEGIVIVGSILLAFSIDAWWNRRNETEEVIRALQAVQTELVENHVYFEATEQDHRRVADGGFEMLGLTGPDPSPDVSERAKFLIGELWVRAGIEAPGTGAVSTLIASGNLARIQNSELRQALSLWPDFIDRQQQLVELIAGENRFFERMILYVAQLDIDLVNGMGTHLEAQAEFRDRAPSASSFSSDYSGLLSDRQFESAVTSRTTTALIGAELSRRARTRIEELLEVIEEELR